MASSSPKMWTASYIDLPLHTVAHSAGLAIDIGGSAVKIVYRPKEKNPREGEPLIAEGRERIRLSVYPRADLDKALKEIADHADIRRKDDKDIPTINTTGIGSNELRKRLMECLRIETKNLAEFDLFVKCFKQLSTVLTYGELTDPLNEKASIEIKKMMEDALSAMAEFNQYSDVDVSNFTPQNQSEEEDQELSNEMPYAQADKDLFPCHVAMLGSGFGVLQVNKDGAFSIKEGSNRGGASFLGIGNLLTGSSSFEELVGLAETGSDREVNLYSNDFEVDQDAGDMYGMAVSGSFLTFCFGKTRYKPKDDFSKAGVMRGLVVQYATDISTFVNLRAVIDDVRNVFFAGNFVNADVIREELSRYLLQRSAATPPGKKPIKYHFLKHGGFYGALGAFLHKDKQEASKE